MRLGELKSAIRKMSGNPFIRVTIAPGIPAINVTAQKTPLLAALDMAFPHGKTQETGLTINEASKMLVAEGEPQALSHARDAAHETADNGYDESDALTPGDSDDDMLV